MIYLFIFYIILFTFYTDYFLQNKINERYSCHGGRSDSGLYSGAFYISLDLGNSTSRWYIGATLSYKPV